MLRNSTRRRSSSSASNGTAAFANRRSSITLKDIEYIQTVIARAKQISAQVILLIVVTAPLFIHFYYTLIYKYKGNIWNVHKNWRRFLLKIGHPFPWILVFATIPLQFLFFWLLPANEKRLRNNAGQLIRQRWNAFSACLLQMLLYSFGACLDIYRADILVHYWSGVMFASLILCLLLQWFIFCFVENGSGDEDSSDSTSLHSFYFGRHSQPSIFDMDVKAFLTNRVMCPIWACYLISAFARQRFLFDKTTPAFLCTALLHFLYLFRRVWSDNCSPDTLDNQNDRAGFYRLWGVLVFLPTLYLTPVTLSCQTDSTPSNTFCTIVFIFGLCFQLLTSSIDGQKREFRLMNGQMKINDKDPYYVLAKYRRETGEGATNLLLGSGFYGSARHLNYTFEFFSFLAWTLPLRFEYPVAYFPVLFLLLLLLGRMSRDELRCLLKYHQNWIQYTNRVPYLLIPHVY
ncbi:7-dehydrocholesterol reductase [Aphelenchoides bicaudatus]|nr:7-dehydrocholesterol reductase [Aphelenchoides bicaudatus]